MPTINDIATFLNQLAPAALAENWDNVGLLVGDPATSVERIMTCLTVTGDSADEAIEEKADLIITHHPLPFRPLGRITTETPEGRYLLRLIGAGVAIYSAHTAFDSTAGGINERLADGLELTEVAPLRPHEEMVGAGSGRCGNLNGTVTTADLAARLKAFLGLDHIRVVGDPQRELHRVAVACGSAGEFLDAARQTQCDAFVTGEASFHTCLAAEANDVALLLTGHFASERFAMQRLAEVLNREVADVTVWASRREKDPLRAV